jgi:hypothetical protein
MSDEYKPRFSFEITEYQKERADHLISVYGIRKSLFGIILDDVLDLIEKNGTIAIGIILDRAARPREILPSLSKVNKFTKENSNG